MKGKYAKTSHGGSKQVQNVNGMPVRVAGEHRSCICGVIVKKGIMYESESNLFCSRKCVVENSSVKEVD